MLRFVNQNFFFCFVFLISLSCQQNYGNKLESEQLDVYYMQKKDEMYARKIGEFWKENNYLTNKKQSLQLDYSEGVYLLKLVVSDTLVLKNLSFDERNILLGLQKEIGEKVFPKNNFEIVLSDQRFKSLYNINQ